MDKVYIGIDPGKKGAMAIISSSGIDLLTYSEQAFAQTLLQYKDRSSVKVCLEKVASRPKQSSVATFNFGLNFGIIQGILIAYNIPYQLVPPQKWKKEFSLSSDKSKSIEVCKHLFPNIDLKRTSRCTKDDDGLAEALLLAEYCRRKL